jgi:translation initiation factor IF-3
MFRGREMLHIDLGQKVVRQFCDDLADISVIEAPPKMLGRTISTTLAPSGKKPKGAPATKTTKENQHA